ncbi:class I SAM-dependent methyltransferase [Echinicola soli]|uniref:Class I SAM-dependent methyltransferase n=1 Tax=Echinicola soli TaxID=2591634 RepID=A0A514CIZ6_9BACT|nr:class I SAM-dependent methyltransferase [Echinicola soli]QDH79801.1 class I SAM-dependent methyltransferase [Echinicola soli]
MDLEDKKYIHSETVHNTTAAEIITPMVIELISPQSVLDVGCGIGTWMKAFSQNGVAEVIGVDGDYVDRQLLKKYIPLGNFIPRNLEQPFDLHRKFDLVISLEVAEHLKPSSAQDFVDSLTRHGDTILFSAAVPGQGGQRHINEQWLSYWAGKFADKGFYTYDPFRPRIWNDKRIETWYRQNMVVFSSKKLNCPKVGVMDKILPDMWENKIASIQRKDQQLFRIRSGKVGVGFYLKGLMKSLKYFGRKES